MKVNRVRQHSGLSRVPGGILGLEAICFWLLLFPIHLLINLVLALLVGYCQKTVQGGPLKVILFLS